MTKEDSMEAVAFVGEALAPFFLQDPQKGTAAPLFEAMAGLDVAEAAKAWPFVDADDAARSLGMMRDAMQNGIDDDLIWDYRRQFIGPNVKPAPPWGSVYTDRECVVFGETTLALRAWMRQHGIERTSDERTPEDHIGLMLGLLGWLARNNPELVDEYLSDHLLTWSSHYLEQLEEAAENPFYQALAHLTRASLEGMQREFDLSVTYPKFYR